MATSESSKLQEDLGMAEDPTTCETDLQEVNQMPTVNIRELSPWTSSREGGKKSSVNMPENSVLNKAQCQGELDNESLTSWGIIRA